MTQRATLFAISGALILAGCSKQQPIKALIGDPEEIAPSELQAAGSLAMSAAQEGATLLAVCGPQKGIAYYVKPKSEGWTDDAITAGRYVFTVSKEGKPNVFFKDATGTFTNAESDGAAIQFIQKPNRDKEFGILLTYPSTGVTETYVISNDDQGHRIGMLTSTKPNVNFIMGIMSKVAAFTTHCV
ncbi:hypothetical protein O4H52_12690 [Sphingomonadaceae bacterium G21617-S1]|nr:hypothetical protein [Sphingomonadaceae bacterium G21617-S1]